MSAILATIDSISGVVIGGMMTKFGAGYTSAPTVGLPLGVAANTAIASCNNFFGYDQRKHPAAQFDHEQRGGRIGANAEGAAGTRGLALRAYDNLCEFSQNSRCSIVEASYLDIERSGLYDCVGDVVSINDGDQ